MLFLACTDCERAATRGLFTSGAEYQALLTDTHTLVERAVALPIEFVCMCEGVDGADAELARCMLDLHELGPKDIVVALDEPTRILTVVDWKSASVRPLWRCARMPYWLLPSLVGKVDERGQRLCSVFRAAVAGDSVFACALDTDDTRHALDEVAKYDGFLVLSTLHSMGSLATLHGEEDVDGLRNLLDPQTLAGRAARIYLLSHGPGVLSLATSMSGSPLSDSPVSFGWNRQTISVFRTYDAPLFRASDPNCVEWAQ